MIALLLNSQNKKGFGTKSSVAGILQTQASFLSASLFLYRELRGFQDNFVANRTSQL
jgi:hypothetical protein